MTKTDQPQPFNGINAVTGDYGLKLSAEELVKRAFLAQDPRARQMREEALAVYKDAIENDKLKNKVYRNVRHGIDGTKLEEAGWGIIFAFNDPNVDAIKEALTPLLAMRKNQAGAHYRSFTGTDAYRPGETKVIFLRRFNIGAGPVDPKNGVPYYLLLIGGPELIPYEFQYQLDVQFAVGRLDFETAAEYENYAKAVVAAETGQTVMDPTATFFSVTHPDDSAMAKADQSLVQPLVDKLRTVSSHWELTTHRQQEANRSQLEALLGGDQKPALLFTASHGIEFPLGDPRQETHQGALLCNEWPGPEQWRGRGELPEDFYFAGDQLSSSANPSGMIAFHFACYGGGTPQHFDFDRSTLSAGNAVIAPKQIANRPFVAHLPKKLLGHPKGGALAVVSHVDRAWSYSFSTSEHDAKPQTTVFEDALTILMEGKPLGWALESFHNRYAELAADLNDEISARNRGMARLASFELATRWTENHDARNYIVLGDPAVRVAVAGSRTLGRMNRPVAIPLTDDGRPITVSANDWQRTPASVKQTLATALRQIDELNDQLTQAATAAPAMRQPVLRDGGRSSGRQVRSASTRGGTLRGGGTLRDGGRTTRGGMRSWQPPTEDDDSES